MTSKTQLLADYDLFLMDVDGSVITTQSGKTFPVNEHDWKFLPGVVDTCWELVSAGKTIELISNQGGVGFEKATVTEAQIRTKIDLIAHLLGAKTALVCCSMPSDSRVRPQYRYPDSRRKPGPGMLFEAMEIANVPADRTIMLGDRPEDEGAALAAKTHYMDAAAFFKIMTQKDPIYWSSLAHKLHLKHLISEYEGFDKRWIAPLYIMSALDPSWEDTANITRDGIAFWHIVDQPWSETEMYLVRLAATLHGVRLQGLDPLELATRLDERQMAIALSALRLRNEGWPETPPDLRFMGRQLQPHCVELYEDNAGGLYLRMGHGAAPVFLERPDITGTTFAQSAEVILRGETSNWSPELVVSSDQAAEALAACKHIATYYAGGRIRVHTRPGSIGVVFIDFKPEGAEYPFDFQE